MASVISLYPQLNEDILTKVRYEYSEYEFYYTSDDEEYDLKSEGIDGSELIFRLNDDRGAWTPDSYNLGIHRSLDCMSCMNMFGEKGIACQEAVIGVALAWSSSNSRQRGTIPYSGDITNTCVPQNLELDCAFNKAQLRGSVELETVLYIKEPAKEPKENEKHLANKKGYLLGTLGEKIIIQFDGSGSMFPIFEEQKPGCPLWRVACDWDDPLYDAFSDCVKIYLNKAHRSYKQIDRTNEKTFVPQLLNEIMASALTLIITKIKSDEDAWAAIQTGDNPQEGSLASAIDYFCNTLGWKTDSPEKLSLSIREFFERGGR